MRARQNSPQIEMVRLDRLTPHPNTPRHHPRRQINKLKTSLQEYGFILPILIDGSGMIVAGHARFAAARELGYEEVPGIRITHLTNEQLRAYHIADNKLAEGAQWDRERLAIEFEFLAEANFDLQLTGFETPEIDLVMGLARDKEYDDLADEVELPTEDTTAISRIGDIWALGRHRLICGNSLEIDTYRALLGDVSADMIFTDVPYNVPVNGHVSGLGATKHREFAMASGEMSLDEFTAFLTTVFKNLVSFSRDGSIHFQCIDWRHVDEMSNAARSAELETKNLCVWDKTAAGMGSLYRSQHELVFVYKNGTAPHINNVELGVHGRHRSNVWTYPGANTFSKSRSKKLVSHPTVKPVAMVADAMLDCSRQNDIILDPFAGSGTIFIAAEKTGRRGYGIELDPLYVDSTIRRWEKLTGEKARHAELNLTLDEVAAYRHNLVEF